MNNNRKDSLVVLICLILLAVVMYHTARKIVELGVPGAQPWQDAAYESFIQVGTLR